MLLRLRQGSTSALVATAAAAVTSDTAAESGLIVSTLNGCCEFLQSAGRSFDPISIPEWPSSQVVCSRVCSCRAYILQL